MLVLIDVLDPLLKPTHSVSAIASLGVSLAALTIVHSIQSSLEWLHRKFVSVSFGFNQSIAR